MIITPLAFEDVWLITPYRHEDDRGDLAETWNRERMAAAGFNIDFQQENHSRSKCAGTVRGLHFQRPPHAQHKLVRVVRGRIWDVVVDLRRRSPNYGRWIGVELSAEQGEQLLIPEGFAHGLCSLEDNTEVVYLISGKRSAEHEAALLWNDATLDITWPVRDPILSDKDRNAASWASFESPF